MHPEPSGVDSRSFHRCGPGSRWPDSPAVLRLQFQAAAPGPGARGCMPRGSATLSPPGGGRSLGGPAGNRCSSCRARLGSGSGLSKWARTAVMSSVCRCGSADFPPPRSVGRSRLCGSKRRCGETAHFRFSFKVKAALWRNDCNRPKVPWKLCCPKINIFDIFLIMIIY